LFFSLLILPSTPKSSLRPDFPATGGHKTEQIDRNSTTADYDNPTRRQSSEAMKVWNQKGSEEEKERAREERQHASERACSSFFFFFSASERSFCCAATHALPANKPFSAVTGPSGRRRSPPVVGPHPPTARVRHSCPTHPPPGNPGVRPRLLHPYLINPSWTPHSSLFVPDFSGRLPFLPPSPALSFAIYIYI
jgi:hypothetical protein